MSSELRRVFPDSADVAELSGEYPWPEGQWLRASMVSTVDGAGIGPDGRSGSISTDADFEIFKALRNDCDVIIAGAGTVRHERYRAPRHARLAVVTRSGRLDSDLPFIADQRAGAAPLIITCAAADPTALQPLADRAEVLVCGDDTVDLRRATVALAERGLLRAVTEGGPRLLADLAAAGLVDEYDVQVTPFIAGGSYPDSAPLGRILSGTPLPRTPEPLELAHVLTDGHTLFLRYVRTVAGVPSRAGA